MKLSLSICLLFLTVVTLACGNGIYSSGIPTPATIVVQPTATAISLLPTPIDTPTPAPTNTLLPTPTNTLVVRPIETSQPTPTKSNLSTSITATSEGRIAFRSTRNDVWDIYTINPDGSDLVNMSNHSGRDWDFVWSPDGRRLAFISSRHDDDPEGCNMWCTTEIYTINADGDELTRLTNVSSKNRSMNWSPDGSRIVFVSSRDDVDPSGCLFNCNFEIYVMDNDGSNQIRLTNDLYPDNWPIWSPDGSRIAFISYRDGNAEIYIMNIDGSRVTRLTNNPANDFWPVWSPDSSRIAFISDRNHPDSECLFEQCQYDIFVMSAPEVQPQTATENGLIQIHGTNSFFVNVNSLGWSPDSKKIVSHVINDDNYEIFVADADGSGIEYLINTPDNDLAPVWSPDGNRIAFTSDRDGNSEIYVMDADGSNQTRLTNNPANDFLPIWSPHYGTQSTVVLPKPTPTPQTIVEPTPSIRHPEWKNFTDGNEVLDVYVQGDVLLAATNGGLVRWNISNHSYLKYTSEHGLPGNAINWVTVDSDNQLWITAGLDNQLWLGTDTDIYVGNVPTWSRPLSIIDAQQPHFLSFLLRDHQGHIWVGAQYVSRFDGETWEKFDTIFPNVNGKPNKPWSIFEDSQGNIWVGAYQALARFDGTNWQTWTADDGLTDKGIQSIAEKPGGTFLLSTHEKISQFDPTNSTFEPFGSTDGLPDEADFRQVVIDYNGKIWVKVQHPVKYPKETGGISISESDLFTYDGTRWHTVSGLGRGDVTTIVPDEAGNLWVGTMEGLFQFDGIDWHIWKTSDGLLGNVMGSMVKTHSGQFWFGTSTGVSVFNPDPIASQQPGDPKAEGAWQTIPNTHDFMTKRATVFVDRDDKVWVSSRESDVIWFDGETRHTFSQTDIISGNLSLVETIFQDNNGDMWFVSQFGDVTTYDGQEWQTIPELKDPIQFIQDTANHIWVVESPGVEHRIKYYNGDTWKPIPSPNNRTPMKLAMDTADDLWLLAYKDHFTQDLWRYDGSTWQPMPIPTNGPTQAYRVLFFDSAGGMWLSSPEGLWRQAGNSWQQFDLPNSGLASFRIEEILEDADGTLWIATTSGISQIILSEIK